MEDWAFPKPAPASAPEQSVELVYEEIGRLVNWEVVYGKTLNTFVVTFSKHPDLARDLHVFHLTFERMLLPPSQKP